MERREGGEFPPQSEASSTAESADLPARKLVRQLDFSGGTSSVEAGTVTETSRPAPQVGRPVQVQQPPMVFLTMQQPPQPPAVPIHASIRSPVKPESPRGRPRTNVNDAKDGTPKKQKQCNCKHSRCLKLYCECFASGIYCDGCNCVNCHNNVENEGPRREAVEATLERNPHAFRPKIASSPHAARDSREETGEGLIAVKHNKGCHCKKSGCLKKYCECFQANILCSDNCKCVDCKNYEGSEERQALFHGDHANNIAYIQQAANAAITDAIGSSGYGAAPPFSKKRRGQELFFGSTAKDSSVHRIGQLQQANQTKAAAAVSSSSSLPVARPGNNTIAVGPSKFTYRSLLADIIQPQDVKELCSVLVVYSGQAAKILEEERKTALEKQGELCSEPPPMASSTQDASQTGNQTENPKLEDSNNVTKGRPMSPSTLALMCDEQEEMFATSAASPNGLAGPTSGPMQLPRDAEAYQKQESIVLTKFRDCLNRLITLGEIKETQYSSIGQADSGNEKDTTVNHAENSRTETQNQQQPIISNGVAKIGVLPQRTAAVVNHQPQQQKAAENGDVRMRTERET